ncbi:hypothetical protein PISMIDRAFT_350725 [Pisolithus microcarpus 441]|uniref:Uncharacterized protein n=1 Tax=Pisolithus microcarpus 441 TaxID=765257 RepID=A0A0C9XQM8_9AGAM|nr:hypothetical protein PISMIDRAFT_350725 [Pisolithus microcarpus 441]
MSRRLDRISLPLSTYSPPNSDDRHFLPLLTASSYGHRALKLIQNVFLERLSSPLSAFVQLQLPYAIHRA